MDLEADAETFKEELKQQIPAFDQQNIRLNKYWNRAGVGVTFKYVDSENKRQQKDVAYFCFSMKTNAAMLFAVACGVRMAI